VLVVVVGEVGDVVESLPQPTIVAEPTSPNTRTAWRLVSLFISVSSLLSD